ncbi:MAG: 16S rRNA (guanine(966)-N(2))-methyltransferase RsmD, partial [Clostridia bacterium]|nr:16S rRNA (guanine(966)-N(2))-methyltransferase RsmD [Clostridia bacterium]
MRIIGGEARGRRLVAPEGTDTRPTADKTRESLFNILMRDVPEARVLDLFGGTGALALEAMSRGATSAVICDVSISALKAIQANVRSVMKDRSGVRVIKADYRAALKSLAGEAFDLIFLDPPYRLKEAYAISAQLILEHSLLAPGGILIAERSGDTPVT